jgi:hypothetical protein
MKNLNVKFHNFCEFLKKFYATDRKFKDKKEPNPNYKIKISFPKNGIVQKVSLICYIKGQFTTIQSFKIHLV